MIATKYLPMPSDKKKKRNFNVLFKGLTKSSRGGHGLRLDEWVVACPTAEMMITTTTKTFIYVICSGQAGILEDVKVLGVKHWWTLTRVRKIWRKIQRDAEAYGGLCRY